MPAKGPGAGDRMRRRRVVARTTLKGRCRTTRGSPGRPASALVRTGRRGRRNRRGGPGPALGARAVPVAQRCGCRRSASGACRRSIMAPTSGGARRRVASDTTTITANASGTVHAAGWATSVAGQPYSGGPSTVTSTAARRAAAGQHPGGRAAGGQPAPPDAQHQQRAEARRGDREREPDHLRHVEARDVQRQHDRHHPAMIVASRKSRTEPRPEHVGRDDPGDAGEQPRRAGQERGERAGRDERGEQLPGQAAAERRPGQQHARPRRCGRSSAAAGCRPGRARRTAWVAGRRARPGRAPPASYVGRRRRPGWCRSARVRAAAPSCRGTSPGSASRWRTARSSLPAAPGSSQSGPRSIHRGHLRHRLAGGEREFVAGAYRPGRRRRAG